MSKINIRSSLSDLYDHATHDGIICEAEIFEVATIASDACQLSEKIMPYYIELTGKYQGVYFYDYLRVQGYFESAEPEKARKLKSVRDCREQLKKHGREEEYLNTEGLDLAETRILGTFCSEQEAELRRWEQIQEACITGAGRLTPDKSVKIRVKVRKLDEELIIAEYLPFRDERDSEVDLDELAKGIHNGDINPPELTLPEEMKLNPAYLSRIASKYGLDTLATEDSKQLKHLSAHLRKYGFDDEIGRLIQDMAKSNNKGISDSLTTLNEIVRLCEDKGAGLVREDLDQIPMEGFKSVILSTLPIFNKEPKMNTEIPMEEFKDVLFTSLSELSIEERDKARELKYFADHVRKYGGVSQLGSSTADIAEGQK